MTSYTYIIEKKKIFQEHEVQHYQYLLLSRNEVNQLCTFHYHGYYITLSSYKVLKIMCPSFLFFFFLPPFHLKYQNIKYEIPHCLLLQIHQIQVKACQLCYTHSWLDLRLLVESVYLLDCYPGQQTERKGRMTKQLNFLKFTIQASSDSRII